MPALAQAGLVGGHGRERRGRVRPRCSCRCRCRAARSWTRARRTWPWAARSRTCSTATPVTCSSWPCRSTRRRRTRPRSTSPSARASPASCSSRRWSAGPDGVTALPPLLVPAGGRGPHRVLAVRRAAGRAQRPGAREQRDHLRAGPVAPRRRARRFASRSGRQPKGGCTPRRLAAVTDIPIAPPDEQPPVDRCAARAYDPPEVPAALESPESPSRRTCPTKSSSRPAGHAPRLAAQALPGAGQAALDARPAAAASPTRSGSATASRAWPTCTSRWASPRASASTAT